jgi:hypothetical protein
MVIYGYEVPGSPLVLLNNLDHGHHGNLPLEGDIPMVETGSNPDPYNQQSEVLDH